MPGNFPTTASPQAASGGRFLAPSWVLLDDARGMTAHDLLSGAELRLDQGAQPLPPAQWWAELPDRLQALAVLAPELEPLASALRWQTPVPLSRAALLAGARFELLFLELTARCNEACLHCYAGAGPTERAMLDGATLRQVLEDARALGFRSVQLTGGDPLLSPWLVPAARWAATLGFEQVEIFTNGLALTPGLLQRLRGLPVAFACSFYSFDPQVHDRITQRPGSQRLTARAIRRVLAARLPLRVGVIALEENRAQVDATCAWLARLGVPAQAISVSAQRRVGRGGLTDLEQPARVVAGAQQAAPAPAAAADANADASPAAGTEADLAPLSAAASHGGRARAPFGGKAAVAADGTVYPCIFSRALPLGSVHRQSLREILSAPLALDGDLAGLGQRAAAWADRLACVECRVRAALLGGASAA